MIDLRRISLQTHGALELPAGMLALAAPFAFGFSPAGTVMAFVVGALAIGLALDASQPAPSASTHRTADYGLAIGAALGAVPLALAADAPAALLLAALAVIQLSLSAGTRYSAPAA